MCITLTFELKRLIRNNPELTLLDLKAEAIQWEHEGGLFGMGNSRTMPSFCATKTTSVQCLFHCSSDGITTSQLAALTDTVQKQQEQLDHISQALAAMQKP